ncbi:hypothetical protein ACB092_11G266900 [Castanea dentata]
MDERMEQAAERGDITALHQLLGEDVNLLDHIDLVQCVQTPLHIAASAGHIQFATEVMGLMPSFAWKLNPDGFSPIHLALKNGHIELVRQLLEIDRDLAHVKGKECITPLHYVAETGDCHIDLLDKFLLVSPNSIADVTVRDETALHIALKKEQLDAFKFLVGWLGRNLFKNTSLNVFSVLNQKDDEGNSVLHIVVSKNETQVVSHLLTWGFRFVDVNSTNLEGHTAWDIAQGQIQVDNRDIKLMLYSAGASSSSSLSTVTQSDDNNIDEFYNLIGEDVKLLERIDELPFINTPLHIAASYGNIQFSLELMSLKPSFARKLDPNGFSPIHLALQNGHIELVRRLLQLDGDLVRVKGRERLTPLHYVVKSDEHFYLLNEFLLVCPDSITDVTVRNESALHIALKNDKLGVFEFFMGWLAIYSSKTAEFNKRTVLNWKDNEGNTVLHILVSKNQTQDVRHLLSWGKRFVNVNSKNLEDKTAWDILREDNREIKVMLLSAGAKPGSSLSTLHRHPDLNRLLTSLSRIGHILILRREIRKFTKEWSSMLLVVAALLVTLSFQAVLTPPGGLWPDNGRCITTKAESSYHEIPLFNETVGRSNYPQIIYLIQSNTTLMCEHKAGTAIALDDSLFLLFVVFNTILFSISNSLIVLLLLNMYVKALFLVLNIILSVSYFYSIWTITNDRNLTILLEFFAGLYFVFIPLFSLMQ